MKQSVLIMGGSYFIGKHVVEHLKHDVHITVLNRGNKPLNDPLVKERIADRNDQKALHEALKDATFDTVVDISAFTHTHVDTLLDALDETALKRYVLISTSAVYNIDKATAPFKEDDPLGGDSPFKTYAANKIKAENALFNRLNAEQLVILRPPLVYGEDNYVLRERLIFKLLETDQPIYVPKTNNHVSFVYVNDLALHIKDSVLNTVDPGIYNTGERQTYSFFDWVDTCAKVAGKSHHIRWFDPKNPDIKAIDLFPFFAYDLTLDAEKIHKVSHHETPLKKGLENAYQDYQTIKDTIVLPEKMLNARHNMNKK